MNKMIPLTINHASDVPNEERRCNYIVYNENGYLIPARYNKYCNKWETHDEYIEDVVYWFEIPRLQELKEIEDAAYKFEISREQVLKEIEATENKE